MRNRVVFETYLYKLETFFVLIICIFILLLEFNLVFDSDVGFDFEMGIKLILLLGTLVGVLYCIHLLVQDYQAVTAPKLLRLLFKRDLSSENHLVKPSVRWRRILNNDPIQCARYLYCELGASAPDTDLRRGLIYMLSLKPLEEHKAALEVFKKAYNNGKIYRDTKFCRNQYSMCPFKAQFLLELIKYLLSFSTIK